MKHLIILIALVLAACNQTAVENQLDKPENQEAIDRRVDSILEAKGLLDAPEVKYDTVYLMDTLVVNKKDTIVDIKRDTTVEISKDTVVEIQQMTLFSVDTVVQKDTLIQKDTLYQISSRTDTLLQINSRTDTLFQISSRTDTLMMASNDTITKIDTVYVSRLDTVVQVNNDTIFKVDTVLVSQLDTLYLVSNDTVTQIDTVVVSRLDTVVMNNIDTVYVNNIDTVIMNSIDTVVQVNNDTVLSVTIDTVYLSQIDTVLQVSNDTVTITNIDTVILVNNDTVTVTNIDTIVQVNNDTIFQSSIDTIYSVDTVYRVDTVKVSGQAILDVSSLSFTDLDFLGETPNLVRLYGLKPWKEKSLQPLYDLEFLEVLTLKYEENLDTGPLVQVPDFSQLPASLRYLDITGFGLTDISGLSGLSLEYLKIDYNKTITDYSPLIDCMQPGSALVVDDDIDATTLQALQDNGVTVSQTVIF
jgi:hypothetical protein